MKYVLDPSWWRRTRSDGETVVAGSPVRIFRFTTSARGLLDDLESNIEIDARTAELQSRLVGAGAIHPIPEATSEWTLTDVTVVIPAHVENVDQVRRLVDGLPEVAEIIVIDDGSPTPLEDIPRARVVRHDTARGPAAARNRALDLVDTEFVLFLDHDIDLPPEAGRAQYWQPLLFHCAGSSTALVAPRVRSTPGPTVRECFESMYSPLDMGPIPGRISSGTRISYVPSACVLIRTKVLRELAGFDEDLRYGEDVDFVWRVDQLGHPCRYEPAVIVHHTPRSTWPALLEQRFHYGSAAAKLEARHPGSTRPVRMNKWSALTVAIAISGHSFIALGIASSSIVLLARRLRTMPDRWIVALRLGARGHLFATRSVFDSALRTWWPITAVMCATSGRVRKILTVFIVIRALLPNDGSPSQSKDQLDSLRSTCAKLGDDIAYGAGVWFGAIEQRRFECILPRLD